MLVCASWPAQYEDLIDELRKVLSQKLDKLLRGALDRADNSRMSTSLGPLQEDVSEPERKGAS